MKVVFRVDANSQIGLGHLMRCLALAQEIHRRHADVHFIVTSETLPFCQKRHDWVGLVHVLEPSCSQAEELSFVDHFIVENGVELFVLDGYQFDEQYRRTISLSNCYFACFDDNNLSGELHCDLVINGAAEGLDEIYQHKAPNAVHCLGRRYRVLRQEFSEILAIPFEQRLPLTLVLGGSDPENLTLELLSRLAQVNFVDPVRVITGAAYPYLDRLHDFVAKTSLKLQHLHDCQHMADVFLHSRLTVSAAGSSQFELACAGSPAILLIVADNQWTATQAAVEQGWCEAFDLREKVELEKLVMQICTIWQEQRRLMDMSEKAFRSSDAAGAQRIADIFQSTLLGGEN